MACCIKSNYNYYTSQYYFPPPQENNFYVDYSKVDFDDNNKKKGRGRGRGGKKYGGNYRGNISKNNYNPRPRNEFPKVIAQDLGSEYFPPLSSSNNTRNVQAEKKYPFERLFDIVKGIDEVSPPDWVNTSIVVSGTSNTELEYGKYLVNSNNNIEWIKKKKGKKSRSSSFKEENQEETGNKYRVKQTPPEQTNPTSTLRYADIVKQNVVEKTTQTKSSGNFNVYKGTFSVAQKEPKKNKQQENPTTTPVTNEPKSEPKQETTTTTPVTNEPISEPNQENNNN